MKDERRTILNRFFFLRVLRTLRGQNACFLCKLLIVKALWNGNSLYREYPETLALMRERGSVQKLTASPVTRIVQGSIDTRTDQFVASLENPQVNH